MNLKEANRMPNLQTGLWIILWILELEMNKKTCSHKSYAVRSSSENQKTMCKHYSSNTNIGKCEKLDLYYFSTSHVEPVNVRAM
jgi:hypothetical protein